VAVKAELLDLRYACRTIGIEYQTKQPGHEVVELPACSRIGEFSTISASLDPLFGATSANLAPGSAGIFVTAFALPRQVGFAGAAIQPAVGDQFGIYRDVWHVRGSFIFWGATVQAAFDLPLAAQFENDITMSPELLQVAWKPRAMAAQFLCRRLERLNAAETLGVV